ncbi:nuclear pore complex protein NUP160 isoform X2 [Manihot esculenta]|uniref:nuclear pore complex protein NUP160 isoform X2 n=1 Tax=Manihot esculenta TaxID=3983 RepID=UPI001CC429AA|nr:nuclear pore complex protein NUP160 isoform X2 [Manihot esculenta]
MAGRPTLAGMEVPIFGSDSVKWVELSVAADGDSSTGYATASAPLAPLTDDCASCSVIGDPPLYVIWRINKNLPRAIELLELSANKEFPRIGLRITFSDALCPFAYICSNEIGSPANPFLLYALTISGVAYVFKLRNFSGYTSSSAFPANEVIVCNLQRYLNNVTITSVAATSGCLVVGKSDGSVACFQLGLLEQTAPDFVYELRYDLGISRLWGFVSRGRMLGSMQDLVIQRLHGLKLLFGLHSDGTLQVWDLSYRAKLLSHTMSIPNSEGATFLRLWVGEATEDSSLIPLAMLYRSTMDVSMEMIHVCKLRFSLGDKISLSVVPPVQNIQLEEGECIDVKLTLEKIWILRDNGVMIHNSLRTDSNVEEGRCYALQEEFVAEQLFQSSELSSDDLLWIIHSIFSHTKDHVAPFISSIFLRRLLHPGVHHSTILRATFMDYNKHWTDTEFQSLTVGGLKKEIQSLIDHEGFSESPMSVFCSWKHFCTRYFHNWCKHNSPCGFLVQSSAVIGLVRNNSITLFRDMEKIEVLIDGSSDELLDHSFGLDICDDDSEREILVDVLRCIISLNQQLGKTASAIFYESLVGTSVISSEEIVPRLLKILETGYSSLVSSVHVSDLGGDFALEKELADHRNLRKFSVNLLFSLHALSRKTDSWGKILDVIETYLQFLVPQKVMQKLDAGMSLHISASILVQAASPIAKSMFDSAFDILLFVSYLLNVSGQINMSPDNVSRIQLEFVPMIQDIVFEWLIIHFFCTTPSESPAIEDFSSQLSSLQIDGSTDKRSWNERLGKCDFPLAFILMLTSQISFGDPNHSSSRHLPNPQDIVGSVREFTSWIIWGKSGEESHSFLKRSTEIALILLRHSQYDAVEYLLTIVEANSQREKIFRSIQDTSGDWCLLQHLLGCCLLAQARYGFHGMLKEKKVCEAIRCFFRASSGQGASQALQDLSHDAGLPYLGFDGCVASAEWKLHYYQWAMQIFEQYGISEGACQFALAALEQVDEALSQKDDSGGRDILSESATIIKGRLWANVFKFTLDLNHLYDSYCAILSNPDEESKYICLRRFIIVLYERGGMKVLCGGQIPFIGLAEKIEQELAWKAERSDILTKPNPYKLLYAFEMHRHNWRRAASYIYQYAARLRAELILKDHQHVSLVLQERLNALSASINALNLVHPAYAWIDPLHEGNSLQNECYPSKKAKKTVEEQLVGDVQPQRLQFHIDIEKIENEFVLTSAEYLLSLANVKRTSTGKDDAPSDLVALLIQTNLYDMAFTVLLKFWKGSGLKRELENVFSAMSLKCCSNKIVSSSVGNDLRTHGLLLTSSTEDMVVHCSPDIGPMQQQSRGNTQWETLELYLEKYKAYHAGLPVTVAETLLRTDPQIELPLWLVHMFKESRRDRMWGMTGQVSNPASLFRLYVDYGRFTEATNLLLEYMEAFASVRPSDLIHRKRPFAAWFPYSTIERLWCQLDELINLGHMVDQCDKLKKLLHGALLNHLKLLKVDSDDAISSAAC